MIVHPTGDFINAMKTTFDFDFDLYQTFKQHGYTKNENKKKLQFISFSLITCKLVIRKKLPNNKN